MRRQTTRTLRMMKARNDIVERAKKAAKRNHG